jgi:hypothetical protein
MSSIFSSTLGEELSKMVDLFEISKNRIIFDGVMSQLFELYNEDHINYLSWKDAHDEEVNEYRLRWEIECQRCYLGICDDENCMG